MSDLGHSEHRLVDRLSVRVDCRWPEDVALEPGWADRLRFHLEAQTGAFFDQLAEGIYRSGLDEVTVSSEEIPMLRRAKS